MDLCMKDKQISRENEANKKNTPATVCWGRFK